MIAHATSLAISLQQASIAVAGAALSVRQAWAHAELQVLHAGVCCLQVFFSFTLVKVIQE